MVGHKSTEKHHDYRWKRRRHSRRGEAHDKAEAVIGVKLPLSQGIQRIIRNGKVARKDFFLEPLRKAWPELLASETERR